MEPYFKGRPELFNEGSRFSCPDPCERYGCKEPHLHVSINLVDLAAISANNPCSFGLNVITLQQKYEFL